MPSEFPGVKEEEDEEEEEEDTLVELLLLLLEVFLLLVMAIVVEVAMVDRLLRWHSNEDSLQCPWRHCTKGSPLPCGFIFIPIFKNSKQIQGLSKTSKHVRAHGNTWYPGAH